ncbi:YdeI/OmpD-associated family protein [Hydrotalea sp.]|uniref:YdeI/OmpD-associated family protein n=1 Tax=Hydrotalea sp. TaxID=2881279 RepID=UPI0026189475|nr:YdeI/OmpD-associated family protein [Hydrotalea sp.]
MSNQSLFEKLDLNNERTILIQGLPSSIEKQFVKLSYAKNVTPLLKSKKVDFALLFAINLCQLNTILKEVFAALHNESKLWIAFPKQTSKIVSDLNRDCSWSCLTDKGYETTDLVDIDHVWNAMRFKKKIGVVVEETVVVVNAAIETEPKKETKKRIDFDKNLIVPPVELEKIFTRHKKAKEIFAALPVSHQKEYVSWIEGAKKQDTKQRRLEAVIEKLMAGKKNPLEK